MPDPVPVPQDQPAGRQLTWHWSSFDDLSLRDLYAALRLRSLVFVVEQACPFLDADGLDEGAFHLLGWTEHQGAPLLAAYVRVLSPGAKYTEPSIGRVVTHPAVRRTRIGRQLMAEAIRRTERLAPGHPIRIGAQIYLERFYGAFGFGRASEPYDEDGILHIEMVRPAR